MIKIILETILDVEIHSGLCIIRGVKRKDIQSESGYHDNCRIAIFDK